MTREKDHGRIEKREYRLLTDLFWLPGTPEWRDLHTIGSATSTIIKGEQIHVETRYFISSLNNLDRFAYAVRKHWTIENQLHWCLDVVFDEDASQAKKDNSPLNMNILRKTALALCKSADMGNRVSLKKKRFRASLNPEAFLAILFG